MGFLQMGGRKHLFSGIVSQEFGSSACNTTPVSRNMKYSKAFSLKTFVSVNLQKWRNELVCFPTYSTFNTNTLF